MLTSKQSATNKSNNTTRLIIGGSSSSSLRKPSTSISASNATNSFKSSSATSQQQRQTSQSSLLAAGKSTSRSSVMSDTTASVSSSLATPGVATKTKSSNSTNRPNSSSSSLLLTRTGSSLTKTSSGGVKSKTGPSSTTSSTSKSSSSAISSSSSGSSGNSGSNLGTTTTALPGSSGSSRRVPTLAMSLRDKDQQIKLLIRERDEQKFQAELMARKAEEWEEKFVQSEVEKSHVTSEADDEVVELRRLAQELEDENKRLVVQLSEREQVVSDTQFKMDELECERSELKRELGDKEDQLKAMEQEQRDLSQGKPIVQVTTERAISKAKYEREIEELKEKIMSREEQMMQLRSSLEMRKNEVTNLQTRAADLERKLKIETERSERHLKRIDEINLELKACDAKLTTKAEENDMYEKQVRQLRQELRTAEEKLEQISLARKKDVDILHNKLSAARRGSTTPTSPQPYKTPTPQDEIVRLQLEIRDLKDQVIDREAEVDCYRRDLDVLKYKMENRTLEVDRNNQELARRCQDLLEQNRQSEDTVKQLLKSTTEHSAQLMRATEDLKEANGKCVKLRDEIQELETKLDEQMTKSTHLNKENVQLKDENEEYKDQVEILRQQVDSLNGQLSDLCQQLDVQTNNLHQDREALANQLSQNEMDAAQVRHDLATAKQDLRTSKLQTQEMVSERDRLKADLEVKDKYIASRNDIIETLRHELDDCKKSLADYKKKIECLKEATTLETEQANKELKSQLESLKRDCKLKVEESAALQSKCEQLQKQLEETKVINEEEELKRFDEMRQKHSAELDVLKLKLKELEEQLDEAKSSTLKRHENKTSSGSQVVTTNDVVNGLNEREQHQQKSTSIEQQKSNKQNINGNSNRSEEYETQIEFLNSVVVDMQRKCDDYKNRLAQMETVNIMNEFDNLIMSNQPGLSSNASTLRSRNNGNNNTNTIQSNEKSSTIRNGYVAANSTASNTLTRTHKMVPDNIIMSDKQQSTRPISGRPFCDICNVYDLHHTIYCPKVSEKLASRKQQLDASNNNNNYFLGAATNYNGSQTSVDDLFREYEQSVQSASMQQFSSLRRPQNVEKPRPYCDHCDLFGHTIKSCNSLKISMT